MSLRAELENRLHAQLEFAGIESRRNLARGSAVNAGVDAVELSVVPDIERFRAQLEMQPLAGGECLEHGHVPLVTSRTTQGVMTERTESRNTADWLLLP